MTAKEDRRRSVTPTMPPIIPIVDLYPYINLIVTMDRAPPKRHSVGVIGHDLRRQFPSRDCHSHSIRRLSAGSIRCTDFHSQHLHRSSSVVHRAVSPKSTEFEPFDSHSDVVVVVGAVTWNGLTAKTWVVVLEQLDWTPRTKVLNRLDSLLGAGNMRNLN